MVKHMNSFIFQQTVRCYVPVYMVTIPYILLRPPKIDAKRVVCGLEDIRKVENLTRFVEWWVKNSMHSNSLAQRFGFSNW